MIKNGTRLASQVCDTQVIVVRSADSLDDLRCGGAPMVAIGAERSAVALLDRERLQLHTINPLGLPEIPGAPAGDTLVAFALPRPGESGPLQWLRWLDQPGGRFELHAGMAGIAALALAALWWRRWHRRHRRPD